MWFRRCPTTEQLDDFVAHPEVENPVAEHLPKCEECRAAVQSLLAEKHVLDDLRQATATDLNDARREQIVDICRDAARGTPKDAHA
ncbi:MAG: hypothetical protein JNG88_01000 [Phycisphaerales bacterium]|nr:hypothetical protein [Phycisphaerales bacterium]